MGAIEQAVNAGAMREPESSSCVGISTAPPLDVELTELVGADLPAESIEQSKPRGSLRMFAVLIALYLSMFISALDQTIVATAVPTIASELHSSSGYVWVMTAYLLAAAAGGPVWAKLSDIWGRKVIILLAVAWFFLSSIVCAAAISMDMLIAGRALQGTAAGGLLQLAFITISDLFSVRERTLYLGFTEIMWAVAGGLGPIIGGLCTQLATWRWCFWVNLPVSGLAFALLLLFLDVHNPKTRFMDGLKAIDWYGSLSILAVTLMVLLGINFGGATFPWKSPQVICLIVIGSLMSIFFVYSETKLARYPLMPLKILQQRSNVACLLLTFCHGMVFISGEYYMPLYFQSVKEASPLHSGLLVLPLTLSEAMSGIAVGLILHFTGRYKEIIHVGTVLLTIGTGLYVSFSATTSIGQIIGYQILTGLGAGLLFEPPLIALHSLVSQDDTSTATSTMGFVRNIGTSVSIVIGGVVFQNSMDERVPYLLSEGVSSNITNLLDGGAAAANVMIVQTIADPTQQLLVKEAFASSLHNMWIMYTCLAGCTIVAGMFISRNVLSKVHVETKTGLKEKPLLEPVVPAGDARHASV